MSKPRPPRRRDRWAFAALLGLLCAAGAGGVFVAASQWKQTAVASAAQAVIAAPDAEASRRALGRLRKLEGCIGPCTQASFVQGAAARAAAAALEEDPEIRDALLGQAEARLDSARRARPASAAVLIQAAFVASQRPGAQAQALALLAESYEAEPFRRPEGIWRVRYAAANWRRVEPAVRNRVLDEARWLAATDRRLVPVLTEALAEQAEAAEADARPAAAPKRRAPIPAPRERRP